MDEVENLRFIDEEATLMRTEREVFYSPVMCIEAVRDCKTRMLLST